MSQLVSLKRTPAEAKQLFASEPGDENLYPTTLYLCEDEVAKLGLENASVGDTLRLTANVKVISKSTREEVDGDVNHTVTLALTEAAVDGATSQDAAHARALYGGS